MSCVEARKHRQRRAHFSGVGWNGGTRDKGPCFHSYNARYMAGANGMAWKGSCKVARVAWKSPSGGPLMQRGAKLLRSHSDVVTLN